MLTFNYESCFEGAILRMLDFQGKNHTFIAILGPQISIGILL